MKISLKTTINNVKKNIKNIKYEQKQKELDKWVNIKEVKQPEAFSELYSAREILANYAKANNIKLTFVTKPIDKYGQRPNLTIWGKQNNHLTMRNVNADTKAITTVERHKKLMLQDKDGLDYMVKVKDTKEETFLKRVYRGVEGLKNDFKKLYPET